MASLPCTQGRPQKPQPNETHKRVDAQKLDQQKEIELFEGGPDHVQATTGKEKLTNPNKWGSTPLLKPNARLFLKST